jgi:hypothetical protein
MIFGLFGKTGKQPRLAVIAEIGQINCVSHDEDQSMIHPDSSQIAAKTVHQKHWESDTILIEWGLDYNKAKRLEWQGERLPVH